METVINELTSSIIQIAVAILVALFCNLVRHITSSIKSQTQSEKFKSAVEELEKTVEECIFATEQTFVKKLKDGNRWDADSQKKALEICVNSVLGTLSQSTLDALKDNEEIIADRIVQIVEAKMGELHSKNQGVD